MANSGVEYLTSKEGLVRLAIIISGCITFALIASSHRGGGVVAWTMAAFIISWCFTVLSYFFIATTLTSKMECGVSYEAVDFCLTVTSFFHCLMASIVLPMYTGSSQDERIAACVFGFITTILYAVEGYLLKDNAPGNLEFLWSKNGIVKSLVCVFGCTTFALLDASGYRCYFNDGCDPGRTWAFATYIISWVVSVIILLLHVTTLASKISVFGTIDFVWSAFSCLNYLVASIVLASYLHCVTFDYRACSTRLAADIFGFLTAILYFVEAFLLKSEATNTANIAPKSSGTKSSDVNT